MVVADPPAPGSGGAAVDAVAAAVGDPAQLLDVQVQQLSGMFALVADDLAAGLVPVSQPGAAMAAKHPLDRGAGQAEVAGQLVGALAELISGGQDALLDPAPRAWGRWRGREERSASPSGPSLRQRPSHL
jgi:hypothetical protein